MKLPTWILLVLPLLYSSPIRQNTERRSRRCEQISPTQNQEPSQADGSVGRATIHIPIVNEVTATEACGVGQFSQAGVLPWIQLRSLRLTFQWWAMSVTLMVFAMLGRNHDPSNFAVPGFFGCLLSDKSESWEPCKTVDLMFINWNPFCIIVLPLFQNSQVAQKIRSVCLEIFQFWCKHQIRHV